MTETNPVTRPAAAPAAADGRRRRRRRGLLIAAIAVVVLLVIGSVVFERSARSYAEGYVRDRVVTALGLPNGDGVGVDLGPGSFLLQAAAGSINDLRVTIDALDVGSLSGAAVVTAHGVPLKKGGAVDTLGIDFSVDEDQLTALTKSLSSIDLDTVTLDGDVVRVTASLSLLSLAVPVSVGLVPGTDGGDIVFTPDDISVSGKTLTADQVRSSVFASIAAPLLAPQSYCVASQLPKALTLDAVRIEGKRLVVSLTGDGIVLDSADLATKGSCP